MKPRIYLIFLISAVVIALCTQDIMLTPTNMLLTIAGKEIHLTMQMLISLIASCTLLILLTLNLIGFFSSVGRSKKRIGKDQENKE
jgi:hypothetical protein